MSDYIPFGKEWKKEMNKLKKEDLIDMLRKQFMGAVAKSDLNTSVMSSADEAGEKGEAMRGVKYGIQIHDSKRGWMNTSYYGYPVFTEAVHRKDKLCALPGHEEIQYRVVQIEERVVGNC